MKNRRFSSMVTNGQICKNVGSNIRLHLANFEGQKVTIEIKPYVKNRSCHQNNYTWGVLYPHFLQAMLDVGDDSAVEYAKLNRISNTIDALHEMLALEFANRELVDTHTAELVFIPLSSKNRTTIEQEIFTQEIRRACLDRYDYEIPLPND